MSPCCAVQHKAGILLHAGSWAALLESIMKQYHSKRCSCPPAGPLPVGLAGPGTATALAALPAAEGPGRA